MPRKPKPAARRPTDYRSVSITIDPATEARLADLERGNPDVRGLSAAIRYAARIAEAALLPPLIPPHAGGRRGA